MAIEYLVLGFTVYNEARVKQRKGAAIFQYNPYEPADGITKINRLIGKKIIEVLYRCENFEEAQKRVELIRGKSRRLSANDQWNLVSLLTKHSN